jgi:hypothetical protein
MSDRREVMPHLQSNFVPWVLSAQNLKLGFYPDLLYVWDGKQYGAVSYDTMRIDGAPCYFNEEEGVPGDAVVTGHTWRYVNKNGSPDRRFKNNHQIPIALYGDLTLQSKTGLHVEILVSSAQKTIEFCNTLAGRG